MTRARGFRLQLVFSLPCSNRPRPEGPAKERYIMKITHPWRYGAAASLLLGTLLTGCGGGSDTATVSTSTTSTVTQPLNTNGRLLASNCFQCHGTLGLGGFDKIRGSDAQEVLEYLTQPASSDIMAAHAQGYTLDQLKAIVAYLQQ